MFALRRFHPLTLFYLLILYPVLAAVGGSARLSSGFTGVEFVQTNFGAAILGVISGLPGLFIACLVGALRLRPIGALMIYAGQFLAGLILSILLFVTPWMPLILCGFQTVGALVGFWMAETFYKFDAPSRERAS